jgi:hypothetical protein
MPVSSHVLALSRFFALAGDRAKNGPEARRFELKTRMMRLVVAVALGAAWGAGCRFDAGEELGSFEVDWVVLVDGRPSTCAAAGAARVQVTYEALGADFRTRDSFPCDDGAGLADFFPLGEYEVSTALRAADGRVLEVGEPTMEVLLAEPDRVATLPTVTFRLSSTGVLAPGTGPPAPPPTPPTH